MKKSPQVLVAVQVLPLNDDPYPLIDQAIAAIKATGITYKVCPMETALEGSLDECMAAAKAAHQAAHIASNGKVVTIIKIAQGQEDLKINEY